MGIPILTSAGFVGQRWIIDDYFQAGETIYSGEVVKVLGDSNDNAKLYQVDAGVDKQRVIGIIHTPPGESVGGVTYSSGDYVPVVVQGLVKALSYDAIAIGDPVVPSGWRVTGPNGELMATVASAGASHDHSPNINADGTTDGKTGAGETHTHTSPAGVAAGGHNHISGGTTQAAGSHGHTAGGMGSAGSHAHASGATGAENGDHTHGVGLTGYESAHKHDDAGGHDHKVGLLGTTTDWSDPSYYRVMALEDTENHFHFLRAPSQVSESESAVLRTDGQLADHDHGAGSSHRHSSGSIGSAGGHSHAGAGATGSGGGHSHTSPAITEAASHSHGIGSLSAIAAHTHGAGGNTGDESSHKHSLTALDRAVVVGKCLTACDGAGQEVDILVDIAG